MITKNGRIWINMTAGVGVTVSGGFTYDKDGRLYCDSRAAKPDYVQAGFGFLKDGALCLVNAEPTHFINGLPVDDLGRVCVDAGVTPIASHVHGMPITTLGRVACYKQATKEAGDDSDDLSS